MGDSNVVYDQRQYTDYQYIKVKPEKIGIFYNYYNFLKIKK